MMRPQRPHSLPRTCPQRGGFTLIEVLIALGLSLVLVSAIYSAISLHWRYETAGRDRIERAQISTAVLRLMTEDIGSVTFKAPDSTVDADAPRRDQLHRPGLRVPPALPLRPVPHPALVRAAQTKPHHQ